MTSSASFSPLTAEFDDFLFARINEDSDEMPLSVLSLLARQGIDPWEEAATLAQLPRVSATKRLVSLIAGMPGGRSAQQDTGTLSDRLIALLPRPADFIAPRQEFRTRAKTASGFVIGAIFIAFILAIQLVMISRPPAMHADTTHAPIPSTVLP
jgi:hypothetical protein